MFLLWVVVFLAGCTENPAIPVNNQGTQAPLEQIVTTSAIQATDPGEGQTVRPAGLTQEPIITEELVATVRTDTHQLPEDWQNWPVVPEISDRAIEIYQDGLATGTLPGAFSKVGDCETSTEWFLSDFDKGASHYNLGDYHGLQSVIDTYMGSFERLGVAAQRGFTAASVLNPYWRNSDLCEKAETPLACEFRLNNPSLAIIMVGTNDAVKPATFEKNLRAVIEATIQAGVVPLLTTKADNLEGDHQINLTVAKLAYEYELPMWNFWRAVQSLPDHGLQEDGAHLTWGPNDFADPDNMLKAWPVRNLTALQVLDAFQKRIDGLKEE
jgi:hypothetical protein